jgi:transcriptional regulator with XRE-family HTH domain
MDWTCLDVTGIPFTSNIQGPPMAGSPEGTTYTRATMGRPISKPRPKQAARLVALRKAAGLSQAEFAKALGVSQTTVAYWETSAKPPRSDVLPRMAVLLGVAVETLLGNGSAVTGRRPGPVGKLQRVFEEASSLPRSKQELVAQFVETLVEQHRKAG